jgi:hypothetical protein
MIDLPILKILQHKVRPAIECFVFYFNAFIIFGTCKNIVIELDAGLYSLYFYVLN